MSRSESITVTASTHWHQVDSYSFKCFLSLGAKSEIQVSTWTCAWIEIYRWLDCMCMVIFWRTLGLAMWWWLVYWITRVLSLQFYSCGEGKNAFGALCFELTLSVMETASTRTKCFTFSHAWNVDKGFVPRYWSLLWQWKCTFNSRFINE